MYKLLKLIASPILNTYFKVWCKGKANIPRKGPAIIAAHHLSAFDSVIIPLTSVRMVHYIGKLEYFNGKGIKGRLRAFFFRSVGVFPVDQKGSNASDAISQGVKVLQAGQLFGVYPEGTRSFDGKVHRGKTGVARIALKTGAPIIPTALFGTNEAMPIGKKFPVRAKCGVIYGSPISVDEYLEKEVTNELLHEITDKVMKEVANLSELEYCDTYIDRNVRPQGVKE